uniref:Lipase_3 domain-containing protein n=1 Tax=Globodera pallida TaxID=36090 RepID=A0A183CEJ0_GLOPA
MARAQRTAKLKNPYRLPRPTMVSAFALTVGIALGYAYFLVFNIAYSNCDKMIDATGAEEQWQEAVYNLLMISFCILTLVYIWQRSYFGSQPSNFDLVTRKWVNVVLTIVWIKIVVYKGYLSYQELCQRKEISGYWCPIGTQKIWYYLHKGLLNSAIISCASEFFPVMLVAHWLACGRAEQRADELIRRRQEKKSVRRMLHGMMGDVSKVYGVDPTAQHRHELPTLDIPRGLSRALLLLAAFTALLTLVNWFVGLYFAINYDLMMPSMLDDLVECTASGCQMLLFGMLWWWSRRVITFKRWDPHHKAESRGDLVLIGGSAAFMTAKLLLQILELHFQRVDGFLPWSETILRTSSLVLIQTAEWMQFCSLQRVMALHFEDVYATRRFLPFVTLAAIIVNWVGFGTTFFETNSIKYQLGLQDHHFSQSTLISMIFTQTIYPADYLFCFTAAGCWTDVLLRFMELGLFQLGPPMELDELEELEQRRRSSGDEGTILAASAHTPMKKNQFGNGLHVHHQQMHNGGAVRRVASPQSGGGRRKETEEQKGGCKKKKSNFALMWKKKKKKKKEEAKKKKKEEEEEVHIVERELRREKKTRRLLMPEWKKAAGILREWRREEMPWHMKMMLGNNNTFDKAGGIAYFQSQRPPLMGKTSAIQSIGQLLKKGMDLDGNGTGTGGGTTDENRRIVGGDIGQRNCAAAGRGNVQLVDTNNNAEARQQFCCWKDTTNCNGELVFIKTG